MVFCNIASDNEFIIQNVEYFADAAVADPKNFENEQRNKELYGGPDFSNLDEELQTLFAAYLADRGVNDALAGFIIDYMDYKEQQEYVQWLQSKLSPPRFLLYLSCYLGVVLATAFSLLLLPSFPRRSNDILTKPSQQKSKVLSKSLGDTIDTHHVFLDTMTRDPESAAFCVGELSTTTTRLHSSRT